jgi:hypothetical protein
LPGEIRNLIWKIAALDAAMRPRYVNVFVQNKEIRMAYTLTQSLPLACKDSFGVYFQIYFRHNHDSLTHGELDNRLSVNFACDTFYVKGQIEAFDARLEEKLLPLRKIVLDRSYDVFEFLTQLPNLQELWLFWRAQSS